MIAKEYSRV